MAATPVKSGLGATLRGAGVVAALVLAWALIQAQRGGSAEGAAGADAEAALALEPDEAATERALAARLRAERRIGQVLDDFHDAAADADFARYFGHMTEDAVFLGTDATERWVGEEFRAFARPYFEMGKGWTYRARDRRIDVSNAGDVAWFDELLENDQFGTCRGSGVMVRETDDWKIAQYNLSIPIPNDLAEGVVGLIRRGGPAAEAAPGE